MFYFLRLFSIYPYLLFQYLFHLLVLVQYLICGAAWAIYIYGEWNGICLFAANYVFSVENVALLKNFMRERERERERVIESDWQWRFYTRWLHGAPPCYRSSAPSPETPAPWLAVFWRSFRRRLIPGFVSPKIAIFSTFLGLMVSPSFVWPTTPSADESHSHIWRIFT